MSKSRRYEVSGIGDIGDVHTFSTNHRHRAEEMQKLMGADLEQVEMQEPRPPAED